MNHRERFMAVLQGKAPDRVPILATLTVQAAEKLASVMKKDVRLIDSFSSNRISHRDILLSLGNDAVIIAPTRVTPTVTLANGNTRDEWGIVYRTVGLYSESVERPLAECETVDDLDLYRLPDPDADACWNFAIESISLYKKDYAIVGDIEACIFELAWYLVGLEKFLCDLLTGEEYIPVLLDRIEKYSTAIGCRMIELGADMVWAGDDFGTQTGLLISPDIWRKHFKPRYARMFRAFKKVNPDIKIAYHSCGSIAPIIAEYIEIGLDFLNPIQPAAAGMDLKGLSTKFTGQLGFFGGVDVQDVLPNGTEEEVRLEVRRCIDAVPKEHFIIAPAHNIQADTPVENILAFFDEAIHYHIYP